MRAHRRGEPTDEVEIPLSEVWSSGSCRHQRSPRAAHEICTRRTGGGSCLQRYPENGADEAEIEDREVSNLSLEAQGPQKPRPSGRGWFTGHKVDTNKYDECRTFQVRRGCNNLVGIQARLCNHQFLSIVILFGEDRSSGGILVEHHACKNDLLPPTSQAFEVEGESKLFPYGAFHRAEAHIEMLLDTFMDPDKVPESKIEKMLRDTFDGPDKVPAPKAKKLSAKKVNTR